MTVMTPDFQGKTVLVTGGAVRAGAAVSRAFAAAGANLVIHCLRSAEAAEALRSELGPAHRIAVCDLNDPVAAGNMIREFAPDILINNAASYSRKTLSEEDEASAAAQYRVNFLTPAAMIRALAKVRGERESAVVNILDCAIRQTPHDSFSYAISKKMLAAATRAAARQCAPYVRVNAVAPGNMIPPPGSSSRMEKTSARLPLKRPPDVADFTRAVLFLAWNRSITGVILPVDCGQSLLYGEEEA